MYSLHVSWRWLPPACQPVREVVTSWSPQRDCQFWYCCRTEIKDEAVYKYGACWNIPGIGTKKPGIGRWNSFLVQRMIDFTKTRVSSEIWKHHMFLGLPVELKCKLSLNSAIAGFLELKNLWKAIWQMKPRLEPKKRLCLFVFQEIGKWALQIKDCIPCGEGAGYWRGL
jgi:hypothetical protein